MKSLDQAKDQILGPEGTPRRDTYEHNLIQELSKQGNSPMAFILPQDISAIETLLIRDRLLQVVPYSQIAQFDSDIIRLFLHKWGVYVLPTTELIDFLRSEIVGPAIEIGAGTGAIARALGIPITDAKVQERPEVMMYYTMNGQPLIQYPPDVEKLDAEAAIKKYNPKTVIGAYITHKWQGEHGSVYGVVEGKILAKGIKYINIGNDNVHHQKPILKYEHRTLCPDWLITRSECTKNFIKIWEAKQ